MGKKSQKMMCEQNGSSHRDKFHNKTKKSKSWNENFTIGIQRQISLGKRNKSEDRTLDIVNTEEQKIKEKWTKHVGYNQTDQHMHSGSLRRTREALWVRAA